MAHFVTFEGSDGSGKSTLILKVQEHLHRQGVRCLFTREPGGTGLGEDIRNLILNSKMTPLTELLLYEAARSEHVSRVISPALAEGKNVLCDRFTHSSVAYQGAARGIQIPLVEKLNQIATQGVSPDAIVWLKVPVAIAQERMDSRGEKSRFDQEAVSFHHAVFSAFEKMAKEDKKKFIVLDAAKTPDEIFSQLLKNPLWNKLFGNKK